MKKSNFESDKVIKLLLNFGIFILSVSIIGLCFSIFMLLNTDCVRNACYSNVKNKNAEQTGSFLKVENNSWTGFRSLNMSVKICDDNQCTNQNEDNLNNTDIQAKHYFVETEKKKKSNVVNELSVGQNKNVSLFKKRSVDDNNCNAAIGKSGSESSKFHNLTQVYKNLARVQNLLKIFYES
jgi:hypothetical protein